MVVDGPVIGIDVGYCYLCVAVWHNNKIVVIPNDLGELHTPSYVAFTKEDRLLVGEAAKNQIGSNPENTLFGMKRLIGRRFEEYIEEEEEEYEDEVDKKYIKERKMKQRFIKRLPFKVVKGEQGDIIKIVVTHRQGEEKTYAVQQILSLLLRKMKDVAQEFLGIEVENAVITVPVMFNNLQRRATIDAGRIAGLNVVRILNENTAAALAYVHQQQHKSIERKDVRVCNFGGSHIDLSWVTIDGPHLSVYDSWENHWCGGEELDDIMVEYLAKEFRKQSNVDILTEGNPEQLWRLRKEWEKAKRSLSTTNLVTLEIDCLHDNIDFNIEISRNKFEELSHNFLDLFRTMGLDEMTLDLVLVGGLNHIPMIREAIQADRESSMLVKRDEAVAIGAAIQGAMLSGVQHIDIRNLRVEDITRNGLYIINRYSGKRKDVVVGLSPFPICVVFSPFPTTSDYQKNMTFGVYEGFDYGDKFNYFEKYFLGEIVVEGITPASAGDIEVDLRFYVDENCILTDVTAHETHNGRELSVTFTIFDLPRLSNEEIEKMMVELETWRSYDDILKDMDFAKNKLEADLMGMTKKLEDERLKEKMELVMYRELEVFASKLRAWIREEINDTSYQILRQKKIELKNMQHKMSPFVEPDKVEEDVSGSVEIAYEPVIGVDLGTSNSCAAVWENGCAKIILSEQGNRFIPSYIAFSDEDDEVLYGEVAKAQLTYNPENTIYGIKRLIGRKFNDKMVQDEIKMWPFQVAKGEDNEPMIIVEYIEKHYNAPEIMSILLQKLKGLAEKMLNKSQIKDAVVTVPIHFGQLERSIMTNVAAAVGLEIYQIVSEPVAAAMAHLSNNISDERKKVLVFDLGGGTLDVSLLEIQKSTVEVKAVAWNSYLGGDDFDKSLMKHLIDIFNQKNHVDIGKNKKSIGKLKAACEMAKWRLCAKNGHSTKVEIEALYKGEYLCETIHRTTFEELNQELFERCIEPVEQCLKDAKLRVEEVDEVVLVGGSTRIPKIRELLMEFFQGKKLFDAHPPEEVVASGAAFMGAKCSQGKKDDFIIEFHPDDVTQVSLGFMMSDGTMNFVIPRNNVIPTTKRITFNQMQCLTTLDVYEGEKEIAKENNLLGRLMLSDITSSSIGDCKLEVSFSVDKNNEVQVIANDVITGTTIRETFSKYRIADMRRENEKKRFQERKEKRKREAWDKLRMELESQSTKLKEDNVKAVIGEYIYGILSVANSKAIEWMNKEGLEADLKDIERMEKDQYWLFTALTKKPNLQTYEVVPSCGAMIGPKNNSGREDDFETIPKLLASLGFKRNDGSMKVVIPRNTKLPKKKVITFHQNEYPITLEVYEGEKEMAKENNLLGTLGPISPTPTTTGDWLLEVTFRVSENKDVQVEAKDTRSNNVMAKTFPDNDSRLNLNAITKMIQVNEKMSFEQKKAQEKREAFSDMEEHLNMLTYALKDSKVKVRLGGHIYGILHEANRNAIGLSKSAKQGELNGITKMKEDVELIIKALTKRIGI